MPAFSGIIIGPGLGRDQLTSRYIYKIVTLKSPKQILVLDADILWFLMNENSKEAIQFIRKNSDTIVMSPNAIEFSRLWKYFIKTEFIVSSEDNEKNIENYFN